MTHDLPMLAQGHAPNTDGCHRTHSGVPIHVIPGCTCPGPTVMTDMHDKDGNKIGEHATKAPNHVNYVESGKTSTLTLEQAHTMGLIAPPGE